MSTPSYAFRYPSVGSFAALWNVAINPTEPSFYASQLNADGSVELFVSGPPVTLGTGCGALLKGITSSLPSVPFTTLTTSLTVLVDDSPARQWIEIDTRLTTPTDGLTYPGDLDIGLDGTVRVGDIAGAWHATAVKILPLRPWWATPISIVKSYDFGKKTSTIVSITVNGVVYAINETFAALNIGWTDAIVNQLQIDQTPQGGCCMACFGPVTMSGS